MYSFIKVMVMQSLKALPCTTAEEKKKGGGGGSAKAGNVLSVICLS